MHINMYAYLPPPKNSIRFSKVNMAILLQRYTYNSFHCRNTTAGISFMLGLHQELALNRMKQKNFLSIGIEYLHHSLSFQSYYFYEDSVRLYNGKMEYDYRVSINELGIPILYKHNFSKENNDISGIIFSIGYVYRIMLPGFLSVSYNGIGQNDDRIRPPFKIGVLNQYANSYVHLSIGYQKNNPAGKMKMYIEVFGRYGFSPFLVYTNYTATNLYFGNYFLGVSVGFKWRV